jgi:hypothetical protein
MNVDIEDRVMFIQVVNVNPHYISGSANQGLVYSGFFQKRMSKKDKNLIGHQMTC